MARQEDGAVEKPLANREIENDQRQPQRDRTKHDPKKMEKESAKCQHRPFLSSHIIVVLAAHSISIVISSTCSTISNPSLLHLILSPSSFLIPEISRRLTTTNGSISSYIRRARQLRLHV